MPKTERHADWLNNYYKNYNVNGNLPLKSREIANICNSEIGTTASTKGPSPKNRRIMTNGVDAQIVGRHMQELKKKAAGQPRSTRRTQTAKNRIDKVLAKRGGRLWTGDRMLLAMLNKTGPANIKNYVEEKNRQKGQRAEEAGGQVLQDWKAWRSSRPSSNKYANKMWAAYNEPGKKDEYLKKLASGLISLETGEAIEGNSIQHPGSSLNPANGYTESTSDGDGDDDGDDEAIDADAGEGIVDDDDDYLMDNDIGKDFESQTGYDFMADSFDYPTQTTGRPRSQTQAGNDENRNKLGLAHRRIDNAKSQMNFDRSYHNAGRHPNAHSVLDNTELSGENPGTDLSEYEAFNVQTMEHNNGTMMASAQPHSDNIHSRNMHIVFEPSPQVQSSRYICEPVRQKQNEEFDFGTYEDQYKRASNVGYQVQENQHRYPNAPQVLSTVQSKKRKEPLFEQGVLDVKPSKRQCQPRECLDSERQLELAQHFHPKKRHDGLTVEVSDVGESVETNLNIGTDLNRITNSKVVKKTKTLQERGIRVATASNVRPRNHKNAAQGRQSVFWSIVAHPQGGLLTEQVSSRERKESGRFGRRSDDEPNNKIVILEDCEEVGTVEPSQGTGNRINVDERQSSKKEELSTHLKSLSSPRGYANVWYSQGSIRTSEEPSKSPWQASHHFDGIPTSISLQLRRR